MNGWWAASGFLILLVVLGVAYVLIWGDNSPTAAVAPSPTAPGASTVTTPHESVPDSGQRALTAAPGDVTWEVYQGLSAPVSARSGPTSRTDGVWSGYAHNPTGALLAAAYFSYAANGPDAPAVLSRRTVQGPKQKAALAQATATPRAAFEPGVAPAIAGFLFRGTYSAESVTIWIGVRSQDITPYVVVPLRWVDGDWQLDLSSVDSTPVNALPGTPAASLPGLGFVSWGAAGG
jgi:hypothetical protein